MVNGVDTTDLTRWFSDEEMAKLPRWLQKKIATNKAHQNKNKQKIEARKKSKVSAVGTESASGSNSASNETNTLSSEQTQMVAAVINGLHNANRNTPQVNNSTRFPLNGRSATVAATTQGRNNSNTSNNNNNGSAQVDDSSVVTFDHLGNVV